MKKIYLLLSLILFSVQSFAGSCPDGSDPIKSVSDDGTYFVYKCGGGSSNNNNSTAETSSNTSSSVKGSKIEIYDVVFSANTKEELLNRIVSKLDYDFSKHKLATHIQDTNCKFVINKIGYDKSELGVIENWSMANGFVNIKDANVDFVNASWRMAGLSTDPSYLKDEMNIKLTADGHFVGKMAFFNNSVKKGEVPINPLYPTLTKHQRSTTAKFNDNKMTNAKFFIDVEDWAGGVLSIFGCKDGILKQKEVKKKAVKEKEESVIKEEKEDKFKSEKSELFKNIKSSDALDGYYSFTLVQSPMTQLGGGSLEINNGIVTITRDSQGIVKPSYASFEGRIDQNGDIKAIFYFHPCSGCEDKLVEFDGNLNKKKLSGQYNNLQIHFYLTGKKGDVIKVETKTVESKTVETKKIETSDSDPTVSKVIEVTHGDKFIVNIAEPHELAGNDIKVNLRDIDAPDATKSCPKQLELGIKVRDYVSKKLENASSITLVNFRKTNTKIIAHLIVDGKDLGDELVEMGYASEEYGFWKPYYCSALTAVQAGQQLFNQDPEKALFWLERSLVLDPEGSNNTKSTYLLSELYSLMGDEKKSIDYLKQSASIGWLQAMEKLGGLYLNGIGIKQDKNQAKKWLKKAHEKGSQNAEFLYCSSLPKAKQNSCKF
ncbi:thermonuclease family protein [Candidatus Pseudothioglobus sp. Uisw_016]|jgi:endonuclease YncB( thermonuclease family)|uniref:thermonuclease family protein n=1 Tax=Candidatus Pseudothioglobus sp. Uisw_016 TaxID=3230995 RepID=UPI003A886DA5